MICRDTPLMGGWLGVSVGQWVGQVKSLFNKSWHNWDNSILFEDYDLWRHLHLWVGVWVVLWMGGSVGQWVGSGHITKYRINLDLIKIIKFCLKRFMICWGHPHLWVVCMGQWVGSGQMTNLIKLELINIIWFCLKIYNLLRDPYLWVDGWVNGWAHVKPLKSNKSWPDRDNSIMDILDILLDILLKPPQPFIGLFLF